MNKLKLIMSNDLTTSAEQVINEIAPLFDANEEHIVIVPDKFSLITEKLIFSKLNIDCTFNIRVMGINRFASSVMQKHNLGQTFSQTSSLIAVARAINNCKEDFLYFPKTYNNFGFAQSIKNTISQLKTSLITSDMLLPLTQKNNKVHDLQLLYAEYQKIKGDAVDVADFLDQFVEVCSDDVGLGDTNFYFAFFDSMTKQGLKILEMLTKVAKSVCVGIVAKSQDQKNGFLIDKTFYDSIIDMAKKQQLQVEKKFVSSANFISVFMAKNLYLSNPQVLEIEDFAEFYECANVESEINMIAKKIRAGVVDGKRYGDFVVGISNLANYKLHFKKIFSQFDIPVFLDVENTLLDTSLGQFLTYIFDYNLCSNKFDILLKIIENPFSDLCWQEKEEIIRFYQTYSPVADVFELDCFKDENDKNIHNKIYEFLNKFEFNKLFSKKEANCGQFVDFIFEVFERFDCAKTSQNLTIYFNQKNDLENQKIYSIVLQKMFETLDKLKKDAGDFNYGLQDLKELFLSVVMGVEINLVPLRVDHVFVGDVSKSYFESDKIFFLAGANSDCMPDFQKDVGLLSDKDIKSMSNIVNVNPTVRIINIRKRMKLCSVLTIPKQKLIVSWQAIDEDCKVRPCAPFVNGLRKMFACNKVYKAGFSKLNFNGDFEQMCQEISTLNCAKDVLIDYTQNYKKNIQKEMNCVYAAVKNLDGNFAENIRKPQKNQIKYLKNADIFFSKNSTSISEVESFAKCPFKHFVDYGLKLKENPVVELEAKTIGTIIHFVLQKYFENLNKNQDISVEVENIFEQLQKNEEYFLYFNIASFKPLLDSIKKECVKTIKEIKREQEISNFKIYCCEKAFGGSTLVAEVGGKRISIRGVVDRIDKFNNKIAIIDYKTGGVEHKIKDVYYGNKIQIFIYALAMENQTDCDCVGVLYLPIEAKTKKTNSTHFAGFFSSEQKDVFNFDTNLQKNGSSELIKAKLSAKADAEFPFDKLKSSMIISKEDLEYLKKSSFEILRNNIKLISEGYVENTPLVADGKSPCDYCKYKSICKFDVLNGNTSRKQENVVLKKAEE